MILNKKDIRVDTYTNSSPTIVMYITHIPTGESVKGEGKFKRKLQEKLKDELKIKLIKRIIISREKVKIMIGGKWPEFNGFNFDEVNHYEVHDGELVPCDSCGDWIPGPNFKLIMSDLEIKW